jgi:nitroreductase
MGDSSDSVTGTTAERAPQVLARHARFLITAAARAPSVHNTQPWRFLVSPDAVELWTDPRRKLRSDPSGREMLISCGAALFGLRLAIRSLGYLPMTQLLPDPARLRLIARVRTDAAAPPNGLERQMLDAVPHRHTHRGPFAPGPLPPMLLAGLQHDALAEGATLAFVTGGLAYDRLERIAIAAARRGNLSPRARADIRRWTRTRADMARDGIPATALATSTGRPAGRLPQRDFDLGRGIARLPSGGASPAATAVLLTVGDRRADWLRAGQALYRLLLHAASQQVFASLHTQPLENAATRDLISSQLALPGRPQILLQLGPATTESPTARQPPGEPDSP